jgi:hypothetical protein
MPDLLYSHSSPSALTHPPLLSLIPLYSHSFPSALTHSSFTSPLTPFVSCWYHSLPACSLCYSSLPFSLRLSLLTQHAAACLVLLATGAVGTPIWFGFGDLYLGDANLQLVGMKASIIVGVCAFIIAPWAALFLVSMPVARHKLHACYKSLCMSFCMSHWVK